MENENLTTCDVCLDAGDCARIDAVAIIARGFSWTEDAAIRGGWTRDHLLCEECAGRLPVAEAKGEKK